MKTVLGSRTRVWKCESGVLVLVLVLIVYCREEDLVVHVGAEDLVALFDGLIVFLFGDVRLCCSLWTVL